MKIYIDSILEPKNLNLSNLLDKHKTYDFHFYTEYLAKEGIFHYEKNVLYKEKIDDLAVEYKKLGDFDLIIDYSEIYRTPCYQLPCNHQKEVIYKYVVPIKNIQFVVECVKQGEKCLPSDAYFQIKDIKLLDIQDTANEFNEFLLTLK